MWKRGTILQSRNFSLLAELECSLLYPQDLSACSVHFTPLYPIFLKSFSPIINKVFVGLFESRFPTKILRAFFYSFIRVLCLWDPTEFDLLKNILIESHINCNVPCCVTCYIFLFTVSFSLPSTYIRTLFLRSTWYTVVQTGL